uniref:DUF38 domain-containing protein n=1 Tax=Panagrolaimus davidi TaxID=227884 RepID=A0A914RBE2_9BILA
MDSLNKIFSQISTSNSIKSRKALNPISAKRIYFSGPYHRQNWSLPDSIIYYITKNPSTAKLFQKLVQMCKYFFIKNPIIIIKQFYNREKRELQAILEKIEKRIILSNISYKFWVTAGEIEPTSKIISSIIPHLYKIDVKQIRVCRQTFSFNDFVCFSKNVENIDLNHIILKKENVSNIPLEKLVEALPKLKNLSVNQHFDRYLITSETMKELLKIKHFPQIDVIRFDGLDDTFDIETFYDYMKKNKHTRFSFAFSFSYQLSDAYKNRLEEIIDEVIETQHHDYKVPLFTVPHSDIFKWFKMRELYYSE